MFRDRPARGGRRAHPGAAKAAADTLVALLALGGPVGAHAPATPHPLQAHRKAAASRLCQFVPFQPQLAQGDHRMTDIAAIGPRDVWSVGIDSVRGDPLLFHWNGRRWRRIRAAPPAEMDWLSLGTLAARAHKDVWAFGLTGDAIQVQLAIQHWNGTRWSASAAFPLGAADADPWVTGAVATSATDAWVGGWAFKEPGGVYPFLYHWDGSAWSPAPLPDDVWTFDAIAARRTGDVWALATSRVGPGHPSLVLHWDGASWTIVHPFSEPRWALSAMDIVGGEVITVGYRETIGHVPLVYGDRGGVWAQEPVQAPGMATAVLQDVAASRGGTAWAIGQRDKEPSAYPGRWSLIYRWSGTRWVRQKTPLDRHRGIFLAAIDDVPGTRQMYVAGYYDPGIPRVPDTVLIARLC